MTVNISEQQVADAQRAAATKDYKSLSALLSALIPVIRAASSRYCRNESAKDDVMQETFLQIFKELPSYRGGDFANWVAGIARNCAASSVRNKHIRHCPQITYEEFAQITTDKADPTAHDMANRMIVREEKERAIELARQIGEISPDQLAAFYKTEIDGQSTREAAEEMGVSEGNVRVLKHRFLSALKDAAAQSPLLKDGFLRK